MIVDGFLDWATRKDGIPDKVYSTPNSGIGIACHSVVGREDEFHDGIPDRFLCTDRLPGGRYTPNCAASVMFVLRESGELIQMYPITASTWTSGGYEANTQYWAIEAEGGLFPNYGEQLTEAASNSFIRLVTEFEAFTGLTATPNVNILQHRQLAAMYGYDATACASGRYDTVWSRISAGERYEDDMPSEVAQDLMTRIALLERIIATNNSGPGYAFTVTAVQDNLAALTVATGSPAVLGQEYALAGDQALTYLDQMGSNLYVGLGATQAALAEVDSGGPHTHKLPTETGGIA